MISLIGNKSAPIKANRNRNNLNEQRMNRVNKFRIALNNLQHSSDI